MINTAKECGKHLTDRSDALRFWGEYAAVKQIIDSGRLGKPHYGYFWRGGGAPKWSFENCCASPWCGGGALHDQHVHDVDTVAYLFGMPKQVTTTRTRRISRLRLRLRIHQYIYDDGKVVNAGRLDLNGTGFAMEFRVGFEKSAVMANNKFNVYDENQKDITRVQHRIGICRDEVLRRLHTQGHQEHNQSAGHPDPYALVVRQSPPTIAASSPTSDDKNVNALRKRRRASVYIPRSRPANVRNLRRHPEIPRCSGNEAGAADYVCAFAAAHGLEYTGQTEQRPYPPPG